MDEYARSSVVAWEGRSAAGLRVPAEIPSLDIESSIDRSFIEWSCSFIRPPGRALLVPRRPEFLPTCPMPPQWISAYPDYYWRYSDYYGDHW